LLRAQRDHLHSEALSFHYHDNLTLNNIFS